eukprot:COSAG02_NODE_20459_length_831_cov_0.573770_1_plen_64_part_00
MRVLIVVAVRVLVTMAVGVLVIMAVGVLIIMPARWVNSRGKFCTQVSLYPRLRDLPVRVFVIH